MDRLIYTAMGGASRLMQQQAAVAQNLANANTTGYRSSINTFRAVPLVGEGLPTRTFVVDSTSGSDFSQGPLQATGGNLDVAVQGPGWIAVQTADGSEAYTRSGNLQVSQNGTLQTLSGFNVLGDSGPIAIPPNTQLTIGKDGTISSVPSPSMPVPTSVVGRIKLTNPPSAQLVRGEDGLFRTKDGVAAAADASVSLAPGSVEGSNVNTVGALVDMISLARSYDMQTQLMTNADNNEKTASTVLQVTS
jgi:flagellar basal-body rod protein FlgF